MVAAGEVVMYQSAPGLTVQFTGIANAAVAPGIGCPTARLAGTLTDGRLTVSGSAPEQSAADPAKAYVDVHATAMSKAFKSKRDRA
jgi:hypothetical protein